MKTATLALSVLLTTATSLHAQDWWKPYAEPCTERENVFVFTQKPTVKLVAKDKYEISFASEGFCDVTVGIIDEKGTVVRHLASGVLGKNAPAPFQKNSLKQTIYWNGKEDLGTYVKEPGKMRVRVMLGLRPEFEKRLGGTSPKNFPGFVGGIAIGPEGGYVLIKGRGAKGHTKIRHFDHDGRYMKCVAPPPANMPHKKLAGLGYVEYEPGKRSVHGPVAYQTTADRGGFLPGLTGGAMGDIQVAMHGSRIYWCDFDPKMGRGGWSLLYHTYTDGSTDVEGMKGRPLSADMHRFPRLLASLDGKWLYMCGVGSGTATGAQPVVMRRSVTGEAPAVPFIGKWNEKKRGQYEFHPGSDNKCLNAPCSIDLDAKGRLYVCDHNNGRIQVFSPEGKYLKTIKSDRPRIVRVHKKTGGIYVANSGRVRGKSIDRITKYTSFDNPKEEFHTDNIGAAVMAVDSWSDKPRLWAAGKRIWVNTAGVGAEGPGLRIYEEQGKMLKKISDFTEEAKKEAGKGWFGKWPGTRCVTGNLECDPVRERVVYAKRHVFDIRTGEYKGIFKVSGRIYDDIAFDKRGYMHIHWNPGFEFQGVSRVDAGRGRRVDDRDIKDRPVHVYPEVPYDYGVESKKRGWIGVMPVKDQPGAKFFQDGLGVNMRGDVANESNIYYVPRMEDSVMGMMNAGSMNRKKTMGFCSTGGISYEVFMKRIQDKQKRGEEVYSIRRRPGVPLAGGTVWIWDATGELRHACAATMGKLVNGIRIDEDGALYFVNSRPRMVNDKAFLHGKGGIFGAPDDKRNGNPFTGTLVRTIPGKDCTALMERAPVPLTPPPARPADLWGGYGESKRVWVEGAAWLYAGASPIVSGGCSCPTQRLHLDWYKRTFVPEAYRHSFGVLDTNGNLIMHLGKYGNWDSAMGKESKIPVGGDNIAVFIPRYISGTDNHLVYESWSERLTVLRIAYHAEETVPIER